MKHMHNGRKEKDFSNIDLKPRRSKMKGRCIYIDTKIFSELEFAFYCFFFFSSGFQLNREVIF